MQSKEIITANQLLSQNWQKMLLQQEIVTSKPLLSWHKYIFVTVGKIVTLHWK